MFQLSGFYKNPETRSAKAPNRGIQGPCFHGSHRPDTLRGAGVAQPQAKRAQKRNLNNKNKFRV